MSYTFPKKDLSMSGERLKSKTVGQNYVTLGTWFKEVGKSEADLGTLLSDLPESEMDNGTLSAKKGRLEMKWRDCELLRLFLFRLLPIQNFQLNRPTAVELVDLRLKCQIEFTDGQRFIAA